MTALYYIPRLRNLVRRVSRDCVTCQRVYARTLTVPMGELPADRVTPSPPFSNVGIDYAGPILYKLSRVCKPVHVKAYVAVFICFCVKAVHLELVEDLTTEAFLACLQRFVARRGLPKVIYTDNGSNFVGAKRDLAELRDFINSRVSSSEDVVNWYSTQGIKWHCSPSRAPHFGGLWESAVRSMKTLLRKTIGAHILTFGELSTILTQIEQVLNSRPPLVPIDGPAEDGSTPLTPGHFLINRSLHALPQRGNTEKISSQRRWNLVQRLSEDFWRRWEKEYLRCLQKSSKWKTGSRELHVDDIVLLKDPEAFNRTWPMARVVKLYPGSDGHVRVVDISIKGKIYRRLRDS